MKKYLILLALCSYSLFAAEERKPELLINLPAESSIETPSDLEILSGTFSTFLGEKVINKTSATCKMKKTVKHPSGGTYESEVEVPCDRETSIACYILHQPSKKGRKLGAQSLTVQGVKVRNLSEVEPEKDRYKPVNNSKYYTDQKYSEIQVIDVLLQTKGKSRFILECVTVISAFEEDKKLIYRTPAHQEYDYATKISDLQKLAKVEPSQAEVIP